MPFYDYKCQSCGEVTELCHGMNEKPQGLRCEKCQQGVLQRIFQAVGFLGGSSGGHSHSGGGSCSCCSSGACGSCH